LQPRFSVLSLKRGLDAVPTLVLEPDVLLVVELAVVALAECSPDPALRLVGELDVLCG